MDSDLRIFVQNIGSNFFLKDKQIIVEWEKPFASLRAWVGARATDPVPTDLSRSVAGLGLEPRISTSRGWRPTIRRSGNISIFYHSWAQKGRIRSGHKLTQSKLFQPSFANFLRNCCSSSIIPTPNLSSLSGSISSGR